jgi:hypothetical protein
MKPDDQQKTRGVSTALGLEPISEMGHHHAIMTHPTIQVT